MIDKVPLCVPFSDGPLGSGGSCGPAASGGCNPQGQGNFVCVWGAQGNLPSPGPNVVYSPGSVQVGGAPCPTPPD